MRILVTGGAGFIGSHFVRRILRSHKEDEVINFDKLTYAGNLENLEDVASLPRYRFVKGDIADAHQVEAQMAKGIDAVVNFAAESHVDRSIHEGAEEFLRTNVMGVHVLLDAARAHKVGRFMQISTDEVYGSLPLDGGEPFSEESPLEPNSPYAASKASADLLCRAYRMTYGMPVIVTHASNNYGPYQYPEKLIPFFTIRAMQDKALPLYGDGKNVRDWIHVEDHVAALDEVLRHGKDGEVYNIGGSHEVSNIDVARMILREFKKSEDQLMYVTDRPGHDRRYALNSAKISRELKWKPRVPFSEGLHSTVQWYRESVSWWGKLVKEREGVNAHLGI